MMIHVEPFHADHLAALAVQPAQRELATQAAEERRTLGYGLSATGPCFTIRNGAGGPVLFCGGAGISHPGHATLWSVFDKDAGSQLRAIDRCTRRFIAKLEHRRVDTIVRADHEEGHRWVMLLGFELEGPVLGDYFEDGAGACIYRLNRELLKVAR
jgi:hypothetical protein